MKALLIAVLSIAGISLASADCGSCGAGQKADVAANDADGKCASGCCDLLKAYEGVATALAHDDFEGAKKAAHKVAHFGECDGNEKLTALAMKVEKAPDIAAAREAFKAVSAAVIPLTENAGEHYVMTCPMAKADWIQTTKDVANPYFGSSMLKCGSVKRTVAAK
ncbi:MAG: DUF3347 domain-containing protein [Verrucomicrobia bacterium]|nr:MAG: DUF3347 domain-containing protein [Verrucomicrobiota bacterium]